ncbi:unnamed protein product, partial [Prorocentrum cordatum]
AAADALRQALGARAEADGAPPRDLGLLGGRLDDSIAQVLAGTRRRLEIFEDRVAQQVAAALRQGGRAQESALGLLEEKVRVLEDKQPRFERRLQEVTGSLKALTEERRQQARHEEQIEDRFWQWRRTLEEEVYQRCATCEKEPRAR